MHGVIVMLAPGSADPVDHFVIYRDAHCPALTLFAVTAGEQYIDRSAVPGQPYCYAAKAVDAEGLESSISVGVQVVWANSLTDCTECVEEVKQ